MRTNRILRRALAVSAIVGALATSRASSAQSCGAGVSGHFGWILTNPIVSFVFWPTERSDAATLAVDWINTLSDSQFYQPVTEYGVKQGTWGFIDTPSSMPGANPLSDTTIQDDLVAMLKSQRRVPRSGEMYLIFMPQGITAQNDENAQGYHGWANRTLWDGNTYTLVYGVVEYDTFQNTNVAASHELYEAFTDPILIPNGNNYICLGYCDDSTTDGATRNGHSKELADMCVNLEAPIPSIWQNDYGMDLAQVWSQSKCECFPPIFP